MLAQWHVRVAITNRLPACKRKATKCIFINEPCLFIKYAVREEPAVDGGTIAPGEFVGCVLLEVDDPFDGEAPEGHTHESMERLRQRINFGKWH